MLSLGSVAVHTIVVMPAATIVPISGVHSTVAAPELSVAVGSSYTRAPLVAPSGRSKRWELPVMTGSSSSVTVTTKEAVLVLSAASVAVQSTVVAPIGKKLPDAGTHSTIGAAPSAAAPLNWGVGSGSVAVTLYVTMAPG